MKSRLKILKPVMKKSNSGSEKTIWEETRTVHAERVKITGSYGLELGERFPDYRQEFNIRDAHEVKENWRVEEIGGYLYTVANIIPNRDRGYLTLKCERVNP